MKKNILLLVSVLFAISTSAQDYKQLISEGIHTVESIVEVAERHFDTVGRDRGTGYKSFRRWQYFAERTMDESGKLKSSEFYFNELKAYNAKINSEGLAARTTVGTWEEMGPTYWNATSGYNPGVGRITSFAVEEANLDHIIAGSQTGGVWKSLDGGNSWEVLTDNLANIDVYALAIDPSDSSTYFWGSSDGSIFKSLDSGSTWTLHSSLPGGFVNKILIDPSNTQKMYCSAQFGGIYMSTNGGVTWAIIHPSATNGYDIEFKPGDTNTIYASGDNYYTSTDGGQSFSLYNEFGDWHQEYESGYNNWVISDANQNGSITPRTGNAMAFLNINNYTFPQTRLVSPALNLAGAINPDLKFSYAQVNWVGNVDELKVLYKTSASGNWTELVNYTAEAAVWTDIVLSLPNPSSDYYIAFEGTANWSRGLTLDDISVESTNLGVVFSEGFEAVNDAVNRYPKMIGVSANDPSAVYILESNGSIFGGILKSSDGGNTFVKLFHDKNYFGYDSGGSDDLGQAPRDMDIVVNPNDINDVHIAGINTWRSTDGGANFNITSQWTPNGAAFENIGYCHADVDIMQFVGTGADTKLFVGTDGGIYRADNPNTVNSNYYTDLTSGMGIRQFYKIGVSQTNPVVVTGGSQDNGSSVLTSDGNWTDWWGADGMEGFVDKTNPQIIYGTSQFGAFVKSINSGTGLDFIDQPEGKGGQNTWNWIVPFEQDPILQNVIYCAFDEVYQSNDGGISWTSISQNFGDDIDHLKIAPTNSDTKYLAINGAFYYSLNGSTIWTLSPLDLNGGRINGIAVHPTDPNKVATVTTDGNKVYLSSDNGVSWTPIGWGLPNFSAQALAWQNNGKDGLYVGMNYGVYYTDNDLGNTWTPFSNGLPNVRTNELEVNTADGKLYAATYGRGLWRSNLYDESLSVDNFELDDLSLYPNPANDEVNIKWNTAEDVSLRIYNVMGKLMFYHKSVNLFDGHKIDVALFNSGVYFVKLNTSKGEITKKLVLQ